MSLKRPIHEASLQCRGCLVGLVNDSSDPYRVDPDKLSEWAKMRAHHFNYWTHDSGALDDGDGSLDHILEGRSDVRDDVLRSLDQVKATTDFHPAGQTKHEKRRQVELVLDRLFELTAPFSRSKSQTLGLKADPADASYETLRCPCGCQRLPALYRSNSQQGVRSDASGPAVDEEQERLRSAIARVVTKSIRASEPAIEKRKSLMEEFCPPVEHGLCSRILSAINVLDAGAVNNVRKILNPLRLTMIARRIRRRIGYRQDGLPEPDFYPSHEVERDVASLLEAGKLVKIRGGLYYTSPKRVASRLDMLSVHAILIERDSHDDSDSLADLLWGASEGGVEKVMLALHELGLDVNLRGYACNPLLVAARFGQEKMVRLLVGMGAHINSTTPYEITPLANAAGSGSVETVKTLLELGANINLVGGDQYTPLMEASRRGHAEMARLLLDRGARVNITTTKGTALSAAARWGHDEVISILLSRGADINLKGRCNFADTALVEATKARKLTTVRCLLDANAKINLVSWSGTALRVAASASSSTPGRRGLVDEMYSEGDSDEVRQERMDEQERRRVQEWRVKQEQNDEVLLLLLERGADVHALQEGVPRAANVELPGGHLPELFLSVRSNRADDARALLEDGADVDMDCGNGCTALFAATENDEPDCVPLLVAAGADVNASSKDGTALFLATKRRRHRDMRALLENGASPDFDTDSPSLLFTAAQNGDREAVLLLLQYGVNLRRDRDSGEILEAAVQHTTDCLALVKTLIDAYRDSGAYYSAIDATEKATVHGNAPVVRLLLERGQGMRARGLYLAAEHGREDVAHLLLDAGADVNKSGPDGTPVDIAAVNGHLGLMKTLQAEGGLSQRPEVIGNLSGKHAPSS